MAPVLCLDLERHHKVLDMCASPGSKTKQVLEVLDEGGFVIANEINPARCYMLASEVGLKAYKHRKFKYTKIICVLRCKRLEIVDLF